MAQQLQNQTKWNQPKEVTLRLHSKMKFKKTITLNGSSFSLKNAQNTVCIGSLQLRRDLSFYMEGVQELLMGYIHKTHLRSTPLDSPKLSKVPKADLKGELERLARFQVAPFINKQGNSTTFS